MTYSRPGYLRQVLESTKYLELNYLKVFIDYHSKETQLELIKICTEYFLDVRIVTENKGIAHMKNLALKDMIEEGIDHLFLLEDDILIKDLDVFEAYINYAEKKGVEHLNFAHHGPANKDVYTIYNNSICYPNIVGAFSYYTRHCIERVGYLDEELYNAWEHVEHTERIANAGLTYPFWYFADLYGSEYYLEEIPGSIDNSSIRPRSDWKSNIEKGRQYLIDKRGYFLPPKPEDYKVFTKL